MRKPYGFKIVTDEVESDFAFTARDWSILTAFDQFTTVAPTFKRLVGLDALEFRVVDFEHSVSVNRTKRFFLNQLEGVRCSYDLEQQDLCMDYQVQMPGYMASPRKSLHCMYLGLHATVSCDPGFCTLSAHDLGNGGATREIVRIDLRRFPTFQVDDGRTVLVRGKPRESEIAAALAQMEAIVGNEAFPATFKIQLIGGEG